MVVNPTPTQLEIDHAVQGHTDLTKAPDGSQLDPSTPPWLQTLPVNTAVPTITGTPAVGQVLTASQGTWTGSGMTFAYQWRRAAADISGATGKTYTVVTADKTNALSCRVTATNTKGSVSATSAATVAIP